MKIIIKTNKFKNSICFGLLFLILSNTFFASKLKAAPGGPTQPESIPSNFSKNNVDLFTGDFKYSIPLFDIDGYPINISYSSNIGVDEEASWVGLGWTLNPGAVNRIMRGVPDEFNGEKIKKEFYIKPNWTAGVNVGAEGQIANYEPMKFIKIKGSGIGLGMGVFYNSYNGLGTELSLGANLSIGAKLGNTLTGGIGAGRKLTANSQKGVDIKTNYGIRGGIALSENSSIGLGMNVSNTFNNRTHFKQTFTGLSVNARLMSNNDGDGGITTGGTAWGSRTTNEVPTYMPKIESPMKTTSFNFEAKVGGDVLVFNVGGSIMGYFSEEAVANRLTERMAYGYLNYQNAKDDPNAALDLNREKDVPYHDQIPYIAIPNPTYDIFTVSNASSGGTYRAHRTGSGILFDPQNIAESESNHISAEVNFGNVFEGGFTLSNTVAQNFTGKWESNNEFKSVGNFENSNKIESTPLFEHSYFKSTAEIVPLDEDYSNSTGGFEPVYIKLGGVGKDVKSVQKLVDEKGNEITASNLHQNFSQERKTVRQTIFNPLTYAQRLAYGFEKKIYSRKMNDLIHFYNPNSSTLAGDIKSESYYSPNHFSEIEIINTDGTRHFYGLPTYSVFSEDVTFATNKSSTGEYFNYTTENTVNTAEGRDQYFNKEKMPAYPTSWLLTGVLSDNYVDTKLDGLSDDDLGNFVKFNYTKANTNFKWRLPVGEKNAKFNPGMLADNKDNKGMYSWGEREDWYMHSMESKTQIALFFLSPRTAGNDRSILNENGSLSNNHKYKLDKVIVYSKRDIQENTTGGTPNWNNIIPLKTIHFEYDYSLCGNKLTLKQLYFSYGNSERSKQNKYIFNYGFNPNSDVTQIDRWGKYKASASNPSGLSNSEYPYSVQDRATADNNAKAWLLSSIALPTGGSMEVNYESDDYSYVQNRRTERMFPIIGLEKSNNVVPVSSELYERKPIAIGSNPELNHNYIYFSIDPTLNISTSEDVKRYYFEDEQIPNKNLKKIFFKTRVNLKDGMFENVSGYADIESIGLHQHNGQKYGWIKLAEISEEGSLVHPITHSSWRLMKNNLGSLTYPGSEILNPNPADVILSLVGNLGDLINAGETFPQYAYKNQFAKSIDLSKSFVRLCVPNKMKIGGGARVKEIIMKDNWDVMASAPVSVYGQRYEYTKEENGKTISSGVAEYEPIVGGEENPFRQPINFAGPKGLFDPGSFNNIEMPIGESFFPSSNVGYSKVKVTTLASSDHPIYGNKGKGTGYSIDEFYTARDFPVITKSTNLSGDRVKKFEPDDDISFFYQESKKHATVSQGYAIELNDMHGKPKSNYVYNQKDGLVSSTEYNYKINSDGTLNNTIPVADETETYKNRVMGVDFDFITDMREGLSTVDGTENMIGGGFFFIGPFPIPWALPFHSSTWSEKRFRSAATLKLIRRRGILQSITANTDGSKVKTENLIWDKETGSVTLSKLNDEFKKPLFNLIRPAYHIYSGMGPAYRNINAIYTDRQSLLVSSAGAPNYVNFKYHGLKHGIIRDLSSPTAEPYWIPYGHNDDGISWFYNNSLPLNVDALLNKDMKGAYPSLTRFILSKSGFQNILQKNTEEFLMNSDPRNFSSNKIDFSNIQAIENKNKLYSCWWAGSPKRDLISNNCLWTYFRPLSVEFGLTAPSTYLNNFVHWERDHFLQTVYEVIKFYQTNPSATTPILPTLISSILPLGNNSLIGTNYDKFHFSLPVTSSSAINNSGSGYISLFIGSVEFKFDNAFGTSFTLNDINEPYYKLSNYINNNHIVNHCIKADNNGTYMKIFDNGLPYEKEGKYLFDYCLTSSLPNYLNSNYGKWKEVSSMMPSTSKNWNKSIYRSNPNNPCHTSHCGQYSKHWSSNIRRDIDIDIDITEKLFQTHLDAVDLNGQAIQTITPLTMGGKFISNTLVDKFILNSEKRFFNSSEVKIVAKNSGYHELLFYSFENDLEPNEIVYDHFFDPNLTTSLSTAKSHTGKRSLLIAGDQIISEDYLKNPFDKYINKVNSSDRPSFLFTVNSNQTSCALANPHLTHINSGIKTRISVTATTDNIYYRPYFLPDNDKEYLASVWVNVSQNTTSIPKIKLDLFNDLELFSYTSPNSWSQSSPIEGWRKIDLRFKMPKALDYFELLKMKVAFSCPPGVTCYFDDFRVIPINAQAKSYVYDFNRLRVVAELDENHYATFLDYDDEGRLIRKRKETERGIMTINENRWGLNH